MIILLFLSALGGLPLVVRDASHETLLFPRRGVVCRQYIHREILTSRPEQIRDVKTGLTCGAVK